MSIPDPIVLLDARARYVHPAFQMTRASTKTVWDSAGRLVTVPVNAIGWDHDPATGQSRGYLAEPGATNLLLHSNDLSESYWTKFRTSITPAAIAGPGGGAMAKLVEDMDAGPHAVLRVIPVDDTSAVAFSVILKAAERNAVNIRITEEGGSPVLNCTFDLDGGAASGVNASGGATALGSGIEDLGAGYYRCWLAGSLGGGAKSVRFETRMLAGGSSGYTGDGTSGLYLGYCQAEEGSCPTSYIETGGATATRAADSLILPDLRAFPWGDNSRFTILVDAAMQQNGQGGDLWSIRTNSLRLSQANDGSTVRLAGSVLDSAPIIVNNIEAERYLIACAFEVGGAVSAACNGAIVGNTEFTGSISSPFIFGLGVRTGGGNELAGHISRAVYYPARLSSADLQSLTAMQE